VGIIPIGTGGCAGLTIVGTDLGLIVDGLDLGMTTPGGVGGRPS
jgi:hypothetical protein